MLLALPGTALLITARRLMLLAAIAAAIAWPRLLFAQDHVHPPDAPTRWHVMHDGVVFGTYNYQGGPRGKKEFKSQNWWMAMAGRPTGRGDLRLTLMLSLEPLTTTQKGYAQLFQTGEAYKGLANVDRQHPHDFVMQLSASHRWRIGQRAGFTLAGGPVGEAALGPVAFMHRASAAENPTAPLSHHTFDATHITMGVVTVAADAGPFMFETSAFQGREPDDQRWDFMDAGGLDSYSGRVSVHAGPFSAQVSHGFIKAPERLERINLHRTTASVSWLRQDGDDFTAVSVIAGRNRRTYDHLDAYMVEATHHWGRNSLYTRFERVTLETEKLLFPLVVHIHHPQEITDPMNALTLGGVRDLTVVNGFSLGIGADFTFFGVPERLKTPYSTSTTAFEMPKSFHVFVRLRPPASLGRMFNATMAAPMGHGR